MDISKNCDVDTRLSIGRDSSSINLVVPSNSGIKRKEQAPPNATRQLEKKPRLMRKVISLSPLQKYFSARELGGCSEDIDRGNMCSLDHSVQMSSHFPDTHRSNMQDIQCVTVKAALDDDIVRFKFDARSGYFQLIEEVRKRFGLENMTFQLNYIDNEKNLVVLRGAEDLEECIKVSAFLGTKVRIIISDVSYVDLKL